MNGEYPSIEELTRVYKVACVTAISEMVGMDGMPDGNQLDASIEAGVRAVAAAVFDIVRGPLNG